MTGTLSVVGLGPGDSAQLTPQAREALAQANVIVGYTMYMELVPDELKKGKECISTGMMGEMARCEAALEKAESGADVAVVCSGDPGIYAMAGLVYELAEERESMAEISIVAGIPALSAAAALLGAPLMHDFASVSLSDLLTPWTVIEKRLDAAALADFVIVLYNPRSKKRDWQLRRALEIIRRHRSGDTPVGMVRAAGRPEQTIRTATLDSFDTGWVDMVTTIIIGNGSTRMIGEAMVTPRGYMAKYREK